MSLVPGTSSKQHQIVNPLSEGRDRTRNLMVPSWICFCCSTTGIPLFFTFFFFFLVFFVFSRAAPMAYGSFQARDQIGNTVLTYTTATATQDLSHVCELHHSSRQCQILNPLSEARDQTCILMDTSQIHFH